MTHNVQLAQTVSDYIVLLGLDGTVQSHGPVDEVIRRETVLQDALAEETAHEREVEAKEAEIIDEPTKPTKGKLIVAEEVALGHVGWPACTSFDLVYLHDLPALTCFCLRVDKLYLKSLGGPLFYFSSGISLLATCCIPLVNRAFLAYWADQYNLMPDNEVPVKKCLLIALGLPVTNYSSQTSLDLWSDLSRWDNCRLLLPDNLPVWHNKSFYDNPRAAS